MFSLFVHCVGGFVCGDFFFDFGTNFGSDVRKLFEPELFLETTISLVFNTNFGDVEQRRNKVCAYAFEDDAQQTFRLAEIERQYRARGWHAMFFTDTSVGVGANGVAVNASDSDTVLDRFENNVFSDPSISSPTTRSVLQDATIRVDMLETLAKLTAYRRKNAKVVVKLDIEGKEYLVLPVLFDQGFLCDTHIDQLLIAWHVGDSKSEFASAVKFERNFRMLLDTQECNATQILALNDDSVYLADVHLVTTEDSYPEETVHASQQKDDEDVSASLESWLPEKTKIELEIEQTQPHEDILVDDGSVSESEAHTSL